ncbi:ubiquitin carboxyl-terminal hydrolase 15 [Spinacia oleracea]|uniref:Ubiquitin carboxyl-terminal hydrolase 15 n=1 Tax=Spinacia oleracea TaxID=3562 RepID=A0A9R0JFB8_SPIOL|nr:ubiquitin carboxyl-terminal hydrolase 15 [Spinacia oleracea]XP_056699188.1 ubiquitin carboxyl-terminal hydrolase 15 [Spinacia oleracea]
MLQPRQADIPALFLVLVVLPVVLYILLGKWSEASNKKERINLLVEEAFVESFRPEAMATTTVIPPPTTAFWECARCHGAATTRCSKCKSVRYCSGRCQIIHWRQGHKEQCQPPDDIYSSFESASIEETDIGRDFSHKGASHQFNGCSSQLLGANSSGASAADTSASVEACQMSKQEMATLEKRVSRKSSKKMPDSKVRVAPISSDAYLRSIRDPSKEASTRPHKLRGRDSTNLEDGVKSQTMDVLSSGERSMNAKEVASGYSTPIREATNCSEEVLRRNTFSQTVSSCKSVESGKSMPKVAREQAQLEKVRKGHGSSEPVAGMGNSTSTHETNGITSIGSMKSIGLKKLSKMSGKATSEMDFGSHKKVKVLFPFEKFAKFFEVEVFDLGPRGLLNCGNSCYANAVLQCLTCTKPLVAYLLSRAHSRTCSLEKWCLMCELEQHVFLLRDAAGPLSPSRILSHIRSINCQIGDGSQEDAHEFLRLLVASMQSICLEEAGGENEVHPILQETTLVQQTFGGRLRSMVACLRCHQESERYENIMDLTLEIFGWVESLEDALTQFTTPEDLDGENMYRCGRCASYVRARKQLSIDEAPNILTIVLKRFQEGNYGKINKCITFPEMLDMVPYMTGTNDCPPLYMLYGVVVHVDTLNASFSGHYVSYVKDLQGNWFRIDDTVVNPVPMSQVMSEGAYILFYMRSFPRPPRAYIKSGRKQQAAKSSRPSVSKTHNSSKVGKDVHQSNNRRFNQAAETHADFMEFSDATTSDWSLFTSSDEASFTSESTRDSFSTVDYSDNGNVDPFSSMFGIHSSCVRPTQRMVSCSMFSGSKPVTRYVSEQTGYVLDSDHAVDNMQVGGNMRQVSVPFNEAFLSDSEYQNFVNYESTASDSFIQTFTNVQL